ncbi:MAG: DUF3365 domain-containing protein [Saprospiraceae bacterium]|nr:DUF3365 domain-containing protein [Saprospiraceae bacterium]
MKGITFYALCATILITLSIGCQKNSKHTKYLDTALTGQDVTSMGLLKNNCFNCHNPELNTVTQIAPSMDKIREQYFNNNNSKDQFVNKIINFTNNPTIENSIMPDAVSNFGLMPKQMYKQEELKIIAEYIYENDLKSSEWLAKWNLFSKTPVIDTNTLSPQDLGLKYVTSTKGELGKNLLTAIKEKGSAGAVTFCNTRAFTVTDSMAKLYNIGIKRVSDKPRNEKNKANPEELASIEKFKSSIQLGEKLTPIMSEKNEKVIGHYPIETNKMCLQCHGKPNKDIVINTKKIIDKLYPKDRAVNYGENQIRGIWVVEMDKKAK